MENRNYFFKFVSLKQHAKMNRKIIFLITICLTAVIVLSCKKDPPSILKIYVRSSKYTLVTGATVRIVGDIDKDTPEYLKEGLTNDQGVAIFNLGDLFEKYDKKATKVAYFTVYAKDTSLYYTTMNARAKANMTYTSTITLED